MSVSDDNYDVSYTFNLVPDADGDNETDAENVTAIKVNMADIVVKKHSVGKKTKLNLFCPKNAETSNYFENS